MLTHRPRRMRAADFSRRLMRQTVLTANDLMWPVFVLEGGYAAAELGTNAVNVLDGFEQE